MRNFIRHPSDIPIEIELEEIVANRTEYLKNISRGGLSFSSKVPLPGGSTIKIKIPLVKPLFEAVGRVAWCLKCKGEERYEVGVAFLAEEDAFRARMVEQVCHIEHYKNVVFEKEGRVLNGEEAALEWIRRYATGFPNPAPDRSKDS